MNNPVYDPRSEDVIKRLDELGKEQDDPIFLREARALVRSANRLYIPSNYFPSPIDYGPLAVSFLYLEHLGARHIIEEDNYIPPFSDMERFSQMYRRAKTYEAQQGMLNKPNWGIGFRIVRNK